MRYVCDSECVFSGERMVAEFPHSNLMSLLITCRIGLVRPVVVKIEIEDWIQQKTGVATELAEHMLRTSLL